MNGKIWVGKQSLAAGRAGEGASHGLTEQLVELGFETGRLKTGTPARVDIRTVDFSRLEEQPGDEEVRWFSFDPTLWKPRPQMSCFLTRTTAEAHRITRSRTCTRLPPMAAGQTPKVPGMPPPHPRLETQNLTPHTQWQWQWQWQWQRQRQGQRQRPRPRPRPRPRQTPLC